MLPWLRQVKLLQLKSSRKPDALSEIIKRDPDDAFNYIGVLADNYSYESPKKIREFVDELAKVCVALIREKHGIGKP